MAPRNKWPAGPLVAATAGSGTDVCAATGSATTREPRITKAGNARLIRLILSSDTRTFTAGAPIRPSLGSGHVLGRDTNEAREMDPRSWARDRPSAKIRY